MLHIDGAEAVLGRIGERISEYKIQKVAFIGRYSTGKSTLINALLGEAILPSSPIPTTKAITYILKGRDNSLYYEMNDGNVIHQSLEDMKKTKDMYIQNAKIITMSLINFPFSNLALIDTPGLEDPDQSVTQPTLDLLPETDAVVVLLDANYMQSKKGFYMIALFVIGILVFTGKLIHFALKAAWGITKSALFVIGIPALLTVLFVGGLVSLAIPLLLLALLTAFLWPVLKGL